VAKKHARKSQARADRAPKTIGELRQLLSRLGNPWAPDPRLSDSEPIPQFPTGGDGRMDPVGNVVPKGGVIDAVREDPPSNPHLRDLWIERGLIGPPEKPRKRAVKKLRRPVGNG
jgi:hypothetical protein